MFSGDYLIANAIFGKNVTGIKKTVFDENPNFANVYGVPGTAAEDFAKELGYNFFDAATDTPEPISCPIPETSDTEEPVVSDVETTAPETFSESESISEEPIESESTAESDIDFNFNTVGNDKKSKDGSNTVIIVVIVTVACVVVALLAVLLIKKKKK